MTERNPPASWQEAMSTGLPAIDHDHRQLLGALEELEALAGKGVPKALLCQRLELFVEQIKGHFRREHQTVEARGFAESEEHRQEDERLLRLFEDVLHTLRESDIQMNLEAASFLHHLMVQHIYQTDDPLRRHFRATAGVHQPTPYLPWSRFLLVGDPLIDSEHKILVDYVNRIYELLGSPDHQEAVVSLLHSLLDHARRHFQNEGRLLTRLDIPERMDHMREHDQMLRQAQEWVGRIESGAEELQREQVLEFVREWVLRHILFVDMRLKPLLSQKPPADAG
jgi:hemerythrin